jgi:hypothetical protein
VYPGDFAAIGDRDGIVAFPPRWIRHRLAAAGTRCDFRTLCR